jgi:hypothetical protein
MTERERWIVYPLLLLAIGTALKDKFGIPSEVRAERIICKKIDCTERINSNNLVAKRGQFESLTTTKQFVVLGPDSQPRVAIQAVPTPASEDEEDNAKDTYQGVIYVFDENREAMCTVGRPTMITSDLVIKGGEFRLYGPSGGLNAIISPTENTKGPPPEEEEDQIGKTSGSLVLLGPEGDTMVGMGTLSLGGFVAVSHRDGDRYVLLKHDPRGSGLFAVHKEDAPTPLQVTPPKPVIEQPGDANNGSEEGERSDQEPTGGETDDAKSTTDSPSNEKGTN